MKLHNPGAEIYIPGGGNLKESLSRTTHLGIGAHQDDLEIMAVDGILACYQQAGKAFSGVIVTDGSGSPRDGIYAELSNFEMMEMRVLEQKRAAYLGNYSAQIFLGYPSSQVKDKENRFPVEDLKSLVEATSPEVIYTHNLADKHPTHVAVAVKVIQALRELPERQRPKALYGCEVWRDLGWLLDEEKVVFDCSSRTNLQQALVGVFDSQISGGKRYDLATMGKRVANATYYASHQTDQAAGMAFAMDLTPLIADESLEIQAYVQGFIDNFSKDVAEMLNQVV
jgi:LmbE family N-acetylglucosaminyl deacetylase